MKNILSIDSKFYYRNVARRAVSKTSFLREYVNPKFQTVALIESLQLAETRDSQAAHIVFTSQYLEIFLSILVKTLIKTYLQKKYIDKRTNMIIVKKI